MELKATLLAVSLTAIASSALTVGVLKMGELPQTPNINVSALASQLNEIKTELAREVQAREDLQQKINRSLTSTRSNTSAQALVQQAKPEEEAASSEPEQLSDADQRRAEIERFREQRRAERIARQQPGYRAEQLISAGFAEEDAARIVQIESQESLRQLERQYELRRARAEQDTISNIDRGKRRPSSRRSNHLLCRSTRV